VTMPSGRCKQYDQPLVEIDHWGERLTVVQHATAGKHSTGVRGQKLNVSRLGIVGD
jgi:hypothetical protein